MPPVFLGLATAVPTNRMSREDAVAVTRVLSHADAEQASALQHMFTATTIEHRHICIGADAVADVLAGTELSDSPYLPGRCANLEGPTTRQRMQVYAEQALPLAERAARAALADGDLDPGSITHIVTVSCTGFAAPGFDIGLIKRLGLPLTTERTHVGFMGCHGALNGLRVAANYATANPDARVLLCATELCSLHYHYRWDPKRLVANALFADGAGAAIIGGNGTGDRDGWRVTGSGARLFPDSEFAMNWTIGDFGFDMTLSTKVPAIIGENLRPWLDDWLAGFGLSVPEVRSWAIHPGGPRIVTDVERVLDLPLGTADISREVLAEHGNMSSPTVLFILERMRQRQYARPCVALGFGPGLVCEAALFT